MEIQIRFDGPPGPTAGRFIEVEDREGRGIRRGRWEEDPKRPGQWLLVMRDPGESASEG